MLFDFLYHDQHISVVLSKITGIIHSDSGGVHCTICVDGEPDGFHSTEDYADVKIRLSNALHEQKSA